MIEVAWRDTPAGRIGDVLEDGDLLGFVRLEPEWFDYPAVERQTAWVVDWMAPGHEVMQRALVELGAKPASGFERERNLAARAKRAIALGPPSPPSAFGFGTTGFDTKSQLRELADLTSFALQAAQARLMEAARRDDEHAAALLNVAAVEVASWMRSLDELMQSIWETRVTPQQREEISKRVDAWATRPGTDATLIREEMMTRSQTGAPFGDWTIALLSRGTSIPRRELRAWRWLAGKLLHHGALSAVERRPWRAGAEPRWKWRAADAIYPPRFREERPSQRNAYERYMAGRDVMGSTNNFHALLTAKFLLLELWGDESS